MRRHGVLEFEQDHIGPPSNTLPSSFSSCPGANNQFRMESAMVFTHELAGDDSAKDVGRAFRDRH